MTYFTRHHFSPAMTAPRPSEPPANDGLVTTIVPSTADGSLITTSPSERQRRLRTASAGFGQLWRALRARDPFEDLHSQRQEITSPNFDMCEGTTAYIIYGELPGLGKDDVDVSIGVHEATVTVSGLLQRPGVADEGSASVMRDAVQRDGEGTGSVKSKAVHTDGETGADAPDPVLLAHRASAVLGARKAYYAGSAISRAAEIERREEEKTQPAREILNNTPVAPETIKTGGTHGAGQMDGASGFGDLLGVTSEQDLRLSAETMRSLSETTAAKGKQVEKTDAKEEKQRPGQVTPLHWHVTERRVGAFRRAFKFADETVDMDAVRSGIDNGLLTVMVPKKQGEKKERPGTRKIVVVAGDVHGHPLRVVGHGQSL